MTVTCPLTYNLEDCSALARVVAVLWELGSDAGSSDTACPVVAGVDDIKVPRGHKFCDPEFVLPDFDRISKCAYFDYQRDRVLFRTSPVVRKANRRKEKQRRPAYKVNQVVKYDGAVCCPHCGSDDFGVRGHNSRLFVDLKPISGGLKRWVTRFKVLRFLCRQCGNAWVSSDYLGNRTHKRGRPNMYGWAIYGWIAYSTIVLQQTNAGTAEALSDLFGIAIHRGKASELLSQVADRYRGTYESLLAELRAGRLVHADETWAKVKGSPHKGYVWTFASPEVAVYVYSPSRDGDTPRETLTGFRGVLVSDFYAAYDTLDCPQQKCLVHLLRDLNVDLAKNPFDKELKQLAARFGSLMRAVVETIDRYGLKRYHLSKHKRAVDMFYAQEAAAAYGSEPARHNHHRLVKNRDKLFTFLDHDGVPWNNNNAENAVKRFVSRRKGMGGTGAYSEQGLRDYLLLLSLYQTFRYQNLDFWRFLISGETDLKAFALKNR